MMNKILRGSLYLIMPVLALYLFSCTPNSCLDETESYVKATMYVDATPPIKKAPDSLTVYGLNMDSLIYNKEKNVGIVRFPLNAAADSSVFIIKINTVADTIMFRYISYPHLISKECGYTYYHIIEPPLFTKHVLVSISMPKNPVTNLNEENIRIFY
jgi:hypothetical protein